jgi:hypothetical protein
MRVDYKVTREDSEGGQPDRRRKMQKRKKTIVQKIKGGKRIADSCVLEKNREVLR